MYLFVLVNMQTGEDMPTQNDGPTISKESGPRPGPGPAKDEAINEILPENILTNVTHTPMDGRTKNFRRRQNPMSPTNAANQQQDSEELQELHISTSTNKVLFALKIPIIISTLIIFHILIFSVFS